jgi:Peptidase E
MGVRSDKINIYDIDGLLSEEKAMSFDVIYFSGGNTPYLAKRVRETGFDEIVKKWFLVIKSSLG